MQPTARNPAYSSYHERMEQKKQTLVMLLDDERLLLDLYVKGFTDSGYGTVAFTSAQAAITALRTGPSPDVILFDIHIPEMDGFEFIETVQHENLAGGALMLALTNESKEEDTKRVMELGAAGHFVKSQLSPMDVVAAVEGLLKVRTVV